MALPVVMKSGKNYMTLVLDEDMEFPELLQHIVTKFVESEKFFGTQPIALMVEGRELNDTQKCQMMDAIAEYSSVRVSVLIENDKVRESIAEKVLSPQIPQTRQTFEYDLEEEGEKALVNNCFMLERNIKAGEKLTVAGHLLIDGDVAKGAIVKAGGNIVVLGSLKGQAIAGMDSHYREPYIIAMDFRPQNFRICSILGQVSGRTSFGLNRHHRGGAKIAQYLDGEIQIDKLNI